MDPLRKQIDLLPDSTGVYLLKDKDRRIIYIGKANNIRKRLLSHAKSGMAQKIFKIDFIKASSELDALILEAKLIKKHMPRYNISLRDDKQYPYIKITKEAFPKIQLVRGIADDGAKYFGPFMGGSARQLIAVASRIFGIRRCAPSPLKKRKQPCLDYYIKRCPGPCVGRISKNKYAASVKDVTDLFTKGLSRTIENMKLQMEKASQKEDFETAAELRNRIGWLIRSESRSYSGSKQFISGPKETKNALIELKELLGLKTIPRRIEAFDISNLGASNTVASMAVFKDGKPFKEHYRRFKISKKNTPDDTLSMNEVVFRRYAKSLSKSLPLPDLILIDGGKGQLNSAIKALKEAGVDLPAIGLAKRLEEIFTKENSAPIILPKDSPALHLLQHIRDEAHRFAVKYHKLRRKKDFIGLT
jgi:excinuclease ABC subunit C